MSQENQELNQESTVDETTKQETPAAQGPDLNVSDLLALKNIVEVATQRGAFKATELEAVGKTFNKLNSFLEAVAKKEA